MERVSLLASVALMLVACQQTPSDGVKTFITPIGATINYTSPTEPFVVQPRAGASTTLYWCAAGQAARQVAPGNERLFLVEPIARGMPAKFSLTEPAGGAAPTGLNTIGGDPNSVSVAKAQTFCPQGRR